MAKFCRLASHDLKTSPAKRFPAHIFLCCIVSNDNVIVTHSTIHLFFLNRNLLVITPKSCLLKMPLSLPLLAFRRSLRESPLRSRNGTPSLKSRTLTCYQSAFLTASLSENLIISAKYIRRVDKIQSVQELI